MRRHRQPLPEGDHREPGSRLHRDVLDPVAELREWAGFAVVRHKEYEKGSAATGDTAVAVLASHNAVLVASYGVYRINQASQPAPTSPGTGNASSARSWPRHQAGPMKIDLPLADSALTGGALGGVAAAAARAEAAGFDGVSVSEMTCDPMLQLTVAAGATERVDLVTNIVVAFARSPMTLAVQGRALQDYSQGRLILGLGSQIKPHIEKRFSMPWSAPAARMHEYIRALRAIWHSWESGEPLAFRGQFYTHTLMTPMFTPPTRFPAPAIYLAAVGPRMTAVAGDVADGLLVHPFSTSAYVRDVTLPALANPEVDVVSSAFVVTGRDEREFAASVTAVRKQVAFYGSTPAYLPVLDHHGWGELGVELNRLSKTRDPDKWVQMGTLVDDDVLREFAVVGEPDQIAPLLRARWGELITRYELNHAGIADPALQLEIARSLREG